MKKVAGSESRVDFVDRVRSIVASCGLTLSKVSQSSKQTYGRWSPYFIPHNFYSSLIRETFTPTLEQLCALSNITGYCLRDWLLIFGFDLECIPQLQTILATKRTRLIETRLLNPRSWIRWIEPRTERPPLDSVAPLAHLVSSNEYRALASSTADPDEAVLVKVGSHDTFAYPEIYPGSIVLAKRVSSDLQPKLEYGRISERLYLVEYSNQLLCCRLHRAADDSIVLVSSQLPYPHLAVEPRKLKILAALEGEVRFLGGVPRPEVPKQSTIFPTPEFSPDVARLGDLLGAARYRAGLSVREVSMRSNEIVKWLGDSRYSLAPGSVSEYESLDAPARRVHKILTLCILYGLPFVTFLRGAGFVDDVDCGKPMPDEFVRRAIPTGQPIDPKERFLRWNSPSLLRWALPNLLSEAWASQVGVARLGLHDLFWLDQVADTVNPHLDRGIIGVVSRHQKKPVFYRSKPSWQQPLYVILHRDGRYECACCSRDHGTLVIRPCSADVKPPRIVRSGIDAEVIGRIVAVVRRLS